ncbi:hypothetical protein NPIL_268731 [Nephila pilipes]|uniref:Uncharacterized protein n=1 Tax=Nephila pilipes TaxID=299642 RepID=A0A8X6NK92_NEPPI|nr:hypothetical protein NPIL_268731 [Nephila pilipes]
MIETSNSKLIEYWVEVLPQLAFSSSSWQALKKGLKNPALKIDELYLPRLAGFPPFVTLKSAHFFSPTLSKKASSHPYSPTCREMARGEHYASTDIKTGQITQPNPKH